ncbi:MAG: hypothetical protein FJZ00_12460, partial [Candidatus Sericytochromatia bacterium]|nr:hypothetical protein [Candidatus Tanganyikabacteria bacterium]
YGAPFIWTGKGCQSTCLFCGGSALGHKALFSRTGYSYRPFEQVLHDMEVLGRWSGGSFMFDFDPVTDPGKREYYKTLFERLPKKRYHVAFYCWSLPDDEFIDLLAATFRSCVIGIDAQTYSEPLRARLARTAWIKPFASDDALEHALTVCRSHPNCAVAMYGIVGLATETADDVRRSEQWIGHLLDGYGDVFYELQTTPLSIEPGALMAYNPDKYGMTALRKTFEDYYEFTRLQYFRDAGFHEAPYDPDLPHPYGVHQKQDAPDRVWHDFHRIQKTIDDRILEIHNRQAIESLRIEADRVLLTLRNRTAYQDVWRLVPWAAQEAIGRGLPLVEVDASRAWINVPHRDAIAADERLTWMGGQIDSIAAAVRSRRVELRLPDAPQHLWGALEAACLV